MGNYGQDKIFRADSGCSVVRCLSSCVTTGSVCHELLEDQAVLLGLFRLRVALEILSSDLCSEKVYSFLIKSVNLLDRLSSAKVLADGFSTLRETVMEY